MAGEWIDKKIVGSILVILLIASVSFVVWTYGIAPALQVGVTPPPIVTYTYTEGLTAHFRVLDTTTTTPVTTDDGFTVSFYSVGADPFGLISTDVPTAVAASDPITGVWMAVLDAGSYKVLVTDDTTVYPMLQTVTVPGTNNVDMEVNLNPYMLNVVERSDPVTVTATIYSYNPVTGLYDTEVAQIEDPEETARWQVTYAISAAGLRTEIAAGRLYLTTYAGLSVTSVKIDNVAATVKLDSDGNDDGLTGPYIDISTIAGGSVVSVNVVLTRTAALADGTYSATLYEKYDCHNALLRWWTDESVDIDVVAAV